MIPDRAALLAALQDAVGEPCRVEGRIEPSGGGGAAAATIVTTSKRQYFLKYRPEAPADFFAAEARGLEALAATGAVRTPAVIACDERFLVLERIREGRRGPDYGARLGAALAELHRSRAARFGFDRTTYCGASPQPNPPSDDFWALFSEHRLRHQLRLLDGLGRRSPSLSRAVERAADAAPARWGALPEPPALVHGDLWGGNAMVGPDGEPVLVDPAAHYAVREVDLAMTELFGGFSRSFYRAYQEAWPLDPGYSERRDFYNLYHVLNHATLFGGHYVQAAQQLAARLA